MNRFLLALLLVVLASGCVQQATPPATAPAPAAAAPSEARLEANCTALPDRLAACASYRCQFRHPFTGQLMERRILGFVNSTCAYVEQMPNNGTFSCRYPESLRLAVAAYYRDLAAAQSIGTNATLNTSTGKTNATYTINGKEVANPLQEALDNGQCVISGYGFLQK